MSNTQDKGKDGKKRRAKKAIEGAESADASQQLIEALLEDGFSCAYSEELLAHGFEVTPKNCAGNIFSVADKKCQQCMQCVCPWDERLRTAYCLYETGTCRATVVVGGMRRSCLSLRADLMLS